LDEDQTGREKMENIREQHLEEIIMWTRATDESTGMVKVIQLAVERYYGTKTKRFDVSHIIKRGQTETVKAPMEWKPQKKKVRLREEQRKDR